MRLEIRGAWLWDGRRPLRDRPARVVIEGGRVGRLGGGPADGAETYEFGDATILPGLVDMHTHLGINHETGDIRAQMADPPVRHILAGAHSLRQDLRAGVTTAKLNGDRDFFDLQMREAIREGRAEGPRLLVAGKGIKSSRCTGGVVATCLADGPEAVGRCVEENLRAGADWIKLFASGSVLGERGAVLRPFYRPPELSVAVEKAHAAGRRVAVHCFGGEAADACLAAGVDQIEHGWLLSDRQLEAAARRGTWLCPTVAVVADPGGVLAHVPAGPARDEAKRRVDEVLEVARRALRSGARLVAGTDAMHGRLADELLRLQDLGAAPEDLLRMATGSAGEALGLPDEVGTLREGGPADLLVVRGNALADVRCLRDVLLVVQDGRIVRGPRSEVQDRSEVRGPKSEVAKLQMARGMPHPEGAP
ncbi:MAG: amidohydrolase family protein [Candidatus Methylomirabilales bacterium]